MLDGTCSESGQSDRWLLVIVDVASCTDPSAAHTAALRPLGKHASAVISVFSLTGVLTAICFPSRPLQKISFPSSPPVIRRSRRFLLGENVHARTGPTCPLTRRPLDVKSQSLRVLSFDPETRC